MSRRDIRESAVKLLYNFSVTNNLNLPDEDADFELFGLNKLDTIELEYLKKIIADFIENQIKIDDIISKNSPDWKLYRLSKVDLSILRLAVCEIIYEKIPYKVVINEAVDIAKEYSGEDSHKFINGVLAGCISKPNHLSKKPDK